MYFIFFFLFRYCNKLSNVFDLMLLYDFLSLISLMRLCWTVLGCIIFGITYTVSSNCNTVYDWQWALNDRKLQNAFTRKVVNMPIWSVSTQYGIRNKRKLEKKRKTEEWNVSNGQFIRSAVNIVKLVFFFVQANETNCGLCLYFHQLHILRITRWSWKCCVYSLKQNSRWNEKKKRQIR